RLDRSQLEPFNRALEEPPVVTEDGRPLEPIYISEESTREMRKRILKAIREALQAWSPLGHLLADIKDEDILDETKPRRLDTGLLDLRPVLEGLPEGETPDLIVRWEKDRGALVVTAR